MWKTLKFPFVGILAILAFSAMLPEPTFADASAEKIENSKLIIEADQKAATYTIRSKENPRVWLTGAVAAQVNHRWLRSSDYPDHKIKRSSPNDDSGGASQLTITNSGLSGQPELECSIQLRAAIHVRRDQSPGPQ